MRFDTTSVAGNARPVDGSAVKLPLVGVEFRRAQATMPPMPQDAVPIDGSTLEPVLMMLDSFVARFGLMDDDNATGACLQHA